MENEKSTKIKVNSAGFTQYPRQEKCIKILFVCHGNICRSPISEFVLKDMVEKRGIQDQFEIASAATSTEEIWGGKGNAIYPQAQAVLREHGIGKTAYTNFNGKRARQVTRADYEHYDYLLCADSANVRNTIYITGADREGKIKLLLDFTDRPGRSIADPWYTDRFDETYRDVVEGCTAFLRELERQGLIPAAHGERSAGNRGTWKETI